MTRSHTLGWTCCCSYKPAVKNSLSQPRPHMRHQPTLLVGCDVTKGLTTPLHTWVLTPPTEPSFVLYMEGPTMHRNSAGGDKQRAKHCLDGDVLFIQRHFLPTALTCRGERPLTFQLFIACLNAHHRAFPPLAVRLERVRRQRVHC